MENKDKPTTASADSSDSSKKEVAPLTPEHLFVITELAKYGLAFLKETVKATGFKVEHSDPKIAKAQEDHLRGLVNVAGPETVAHFDRMCQYVFDTNKSAFAQKETPDAK